jgi:hypothetical protein
VSEQLRQDADAKDEHAPADERHFNEARAWQKVTVILDLLSTLNK